ncbi:cytochrome P450 [Rivularia sp. PCC 7116]|uniref:cytochrome P450 n=1 Tax=Rivularia sp. PCC 7116 TaxID=373994 RepID=UPI00029EF8B8|nr:cytochrome P450 [Rivularia sp. PCC 7116]AFY56912.1 cytochrome P450 [Rivularia sp. PCC 7116]
MIQQNNTQSTKTCPFHAGKEYQPFVEPQLENPYSFFQIARNQEPVFYSSVVNAYVITKYEDVLNILKNPTIYSSAKSLQTAGDMTPEAGKVLQQGFPFVSLINSDGEKHRRLRSPFLKVFAADKLAKVEGSIYAIANRLVDNFINDGSVEIVSKFGHPLPLEVILTMYGVPLEKMEQVKKSGSDISMFFSSKLTPERQIECAQSYVSLQHYIASLIEQKRSAPGNDLISQLLTSDLTTPEIVLMLCEMIIAGHKTSANLISKALKLLLDTPGAWQALHENLSLIPIAVEEVLRYDTPAQSMIRVTTQEVTISGVQIPKDSRLLVLYGSANRDSEKYENADKFNIERFKDAPVDHLAFSHGTHHCTGSNLARREVRIALEVLSQRLPNLRITSNQELHHLPILTNRGYESLYLEWD